MDLIDWKNKHTTININGQKISYIDTLEGEKVLFIIHGFATSSFDYHKVIDKLKDKYRVIIPDLIGFGLSSKPKNYYFSIIDQASILSELLVKLEIYEVSVMSHGYGSCILCEMMSLNLSNNLVLKIKNSILLNLSLTLELSDDKAELESNGNLISQGILKISISFEMFKKYIRESFYNKESITENELKTSWELLNLNRGVENLKFSDYFIAECGKFGDKWLKNIHKNESKVFVIWGKNDQFGNIQTPSKIQNFMNLDENDIHLMDECSYFPMLEKPTEFAEIVKNIGI